MGTTVHMRCDVCGKTEDFTAPGRRATASDDWVVWPDEFEMTYVCTHETEMARTRTPRS